MTGYITYTPINMSKILSDISDIHSKIEHILSSYNLFLAKYEYNIPSQLKQFNETLYSVITPNSKYNNAQIVNFNNELTLFIVAFSNILKFGEDPLSISIEIKLLEYVLFLKGNNIVD